MLKLRVEREQSLSLRAGMSSQGQSAKFVLASWGPQGTAATQAVAEGQRLQAELHASSDTNEPMAVAQEDLQVAKSGRRHPDGGKAIFDEQPQEQACVAAVVFLFAWLGRPNLRGMAHAEVDGQLIEKPQEPEHGTGGFDAHQHGSWECGIKLAYFLSLVVQLLLNEFAGLIIEHGDGLLSGVQITAYNAHSRPPSFRANVWLEHRHFTRHIVRPTSL